MAVDVGDGLPSATDVDVAVDVGDGLPSSTDVDVAVDDTATVPSNADDVLGLFSTTVLHGKGLFLFCLFQALCSSLEWAYVHFCPRGQIGKYLHRTNCLTEWDK